MKTVLSSAAICLTVACGRSGGSMSTMSSGQSGALATEDMPQIAVSDAPSTNFQGMLNDVRSDVGAGPVSYDNRLGAAARRHANDMHANNFFDHVGSDGSTLGDRVSDAGYAYSWAGENIARGQQSEASVLDAWQDSAGHRRNNENPRAEHFGLAKAGSGSSLYWVLVLADPR